MLLEQFHSDIVSYTLWVKKNWATFLRPITLEILNRSLPNLAYITFSSCWTSCHNLFESTLENSGAIWRISLAVNKKGDKSNELAMTAPCGSLCHAFDNRSLHFVNWGETLMTVDRLLKSTPRWQVNCVQIQAIQWTKCLAQWTEGSHAASFCVSGGVRRSTVLLQWQFVTAISHLDAASLCQAPRQMVSNFPPG